MGAVALACPMFANAKVYDYQVSQQTRTITWVLFQGNTSLSNLYCKRDYDRAMYCTVQYIEVVLVREELLVMGSL